MSKLFKHTHVIATFVTFSLGNTLTVNRTGQGCASHTNGGVSHNYYTLKPHNKTAERV